MQQQQLHVSVTMAAASFVLNEEIEAEAATAAAQK
jgi:hypothetical protein